MNNPKTLNKYNFVEGYKTKYDEKIIIYYSYLFFVRYFRPANPRRFFYIPKHICLKGALVGCLIIIFLGGICLTIVI